MSSATLFILAGVLGFLITGILTYRLPPNALGKLWSLLAVAGVLLFAWARFQGGTDGLYAIAVLLVFVLPIFIGTLIAGLINVWRERGAAVDTTGAARAKADTTPDANTAQSTGDRGVDLLARRMQN